MKLRSTCILVAFAQLLTLGLVRAQIQSFKVTGRWQVEVIFANSASRTLRFEAHESGKGSFFPMIPKPNQGAPAVSFAACWVQDGDRTVTFVGPVEFPLGNVGLERGTLELKGKFGPDGSITGQAKFFPADQDLKSPAAQPSKSGTFRAVRVQGG